MREKSSPPFNPIPALRKEGTDLSGQKIRAEQQAATGQAKKDLFRSKLLAYHEKLKNQGQSEAPITIEQIAGILDIKPQKVADTFRAVFGLSVNETLQYLGLPYDKRRIRKY